MAIATTTNKAIYVGNGVTTIFTAPGLFYDNSQLQVSLIDTSTGVQTMQTIGTHYSVTGAGLSSGGSVTFVTAPPTGTNVLIKRVIPTTQLVDLKEGDKFPPETIEQSLDLGIMIDQQLAEVDTRCIKLPESSSISNIELPDITLAGNRGKAIVINSSGDGFDLVAVSSTDFANPLTTKGDMVVHDGATASRLPVGADGSILVGSSGAAKGVKYLVPGSDGRVLRANSTVSDKVAYEDAFMTQITRGCVFRSHPDSDKATSQCLLEKSEEIVFNDGTRVQGISNLVLDKTVTGAGGLQAAAVASTWYRAYVIRKRIDGTTALFGQRAKDYTIDVSQATSDGVQSLRRTSAPTQTKLAQSYQPVTGGPLHMVDLAINRIGTISGNVWITIEADVAGTPSGTPLATSNKLDASVINTNNYFCQFIFRSPATVNPATTYWIVLQGDYATSDAVNNIQWAAKSATNPYASGAQSAFNSGAWSATANTDFTFKAYVIRNDTSISLPSGYDQYSQIGWLALDGSSNVRTFFAIDRRVRLVGAISMNVNTVPPLLLDASGGIPPGPVTVWLGMQGDTSGGQVLAGGNADGYNIAGSAGLRAGAAYSTVTAAGSPVAFGGPIHTDYQRIYGSVSAGTAVLYITEYQW